jgi:hypothetical protein
MIDEHEYNEEQLYNCDETALCYRMLPTKSSDINKYEKEQRMVALTILQKQNGKSQIKDPVLEKTRSPRFFRHINISLPAIYTGSKNAWMTRNIFLCGSMKTLCQQ